MSSSTEVRGEPTGTRRHLSTRQADTVARLASAAMEELRAGGWGRLTVRNVARSAGVAPATAYTYFASKEHLVTEVFWQRMKALEAPRTAPDEPAAKRVAAAFAPIAQMVASEPELASACTVAMLSEDAEVRRLRDAIGRHWSALVRESLGSDATDAQLLTIESSFSGLLLRAGMGHMRYAEIPSLIEEVAEVTFPESGGTDAGVTRNLHTGASR